MICQTCGIEAPTRYVAFYQNIGLLVMRLSKSVEGNLCKRCVHKYFWQLTGTTFLLGWWGVLSFVMTVFFLGNNVVRYVACLGMPAPADNADLPQLTDEAAERLEPYADEIITRLNRGQRLETIAEEIAGEIEVRPAQVCLFAYAIARTPQDGHGR